MPRVSSKSLELQARTLAIAILPCAVVLLCGWLVWQYGNPGNHLAEPSLRDGHAEVAGRLKVLAAFLLMTAAGCAVLYYFIDGLRLLDRKSSRLLVAAFVVGALAGNALMSFQPFTRADRYIGMELTCESFKLIDEAAATPPRPTADSAQAVVEEERRTVGECTAPKHRLFQNLTLFQRLFLAIVVPALILGTISCLAMPGRPNRLACQLQTRRLNVHLYLAAGLMVSNLFFLGAVLQWPGYSLQPRDVEAFTAHVSSVVLFWGVFYSILIASFYVPAAIGLFGSINEAIPSELEPGDDDREAEAVFRPLRHIATIAAPALIGLIGEFVRF